MKSMRLLMTLILSVLWLPVSQAEIWVGGDTNCDVSTIQAGLNLLANGSDSVLRVANSVTNQTYPENLILNMSNSQDSLTIQGGYASCQGACLLQRTAR